MVLFKYNHPCSTAGVAQLVRASVCGTEGRGFNSHRSPHYLSFSYEIFLNAEWYVQKAEAFF